MRRDTFPRQRQAGAALLTAMIIVALVATAASAMIWQQWRAIQVEAADRTQRQAQWILDGALDWTRLILREDARSGKQDHLGEPWAVPLAESRLSTFLSAENQRNAADAQDLDAFLSGAITDAQARYNLRNLVRDGRVQPTELATLKRLFELVGLSDGLAVRLAESLRLAAPGSNAQLQGDGAAGAPLWPPTLDDLGWLGLDAQTIERLRPHVVMLPQPTPVNLNTAGREVLAAVIENADLGVAQRLIQARTHAHFTSLEVVHDLLGASSPTLDGQRVAVRTGYFEVLGVMRLQDLQVARLSLLERRDREVRVVWSRRITPTQLMLIGSSTVARPGQP